MGKTSTIKRLVFFLSLFCARQLSYAQCSPTASWAVHSKDVSLLNTGVVPFAQTLYRNVLPVTTQANAFVANTGMMYVVTDETDAVNPLLYKYNTATPAAMAVSTGFTLPTLSGSTRYASGGQDAEGNLYFANASGRVMIKINPTTGVSTTLWNEQTRLSSNGTDFYSGGIKSFVVDKNGDFIFFDTVTKTLYSVPKTGGVATARGSIRGLLYENSSVGTDAFFANNKLYLTEGSYATEKYHSVDLITLKTGSVEGSYYTKFDDISTGSCAALSFAPLPDSQTCPTNTMYAMGSGEFLTMDATTFAVNQSHDIYAWQYHNAVNMNLSGKDGKIYYTPFFPEGLRSRMYVYNPVNNESMATGCNLPALRLFSYYIPAGNDKDGNIYFFSSYFDQAYSINPSTSCTATTLWNASNPIKLDPKSPPYTSIYSQSKAATVDASGNLLFVDHSTFDFWMVDPTTRQSTYVGKIVGTTGYLQSIYFKNQKLYIGTSTGIHELNSSTLAATLIRNSNPGYVVTAPCEAAVHQLKISGSIVNDGNGNTDRRVSMNGTSAMNPVNGTNMDGAALYVTLVNNTNNIVATVPVKSDGTYEFLNVVAGTYSAILSTNSAGSTSANAPLPAGWAYSGEQHGMALNGADEQADGILSSIVVSQKVSAFNANFGINKKPVATDVIARERPNPGSSVLSPVTFSSVNVNYSGSDLEDGNYPVPLTGKTLKLTPGTGGVLYYDYDGLSGSNLPVLITETALVSNFDPTQVFVDPATDTSATVVSFSYAVSDDAGMFSDSKTVTVPFVGSSLPVTFISFVAKNEGNAVQLRWSTATEQNNRGFEIQRSVDSRNWSVTSFVGTKAEQGNSKAQLDYAFTDLTARTGTNYYKLKQIDSDGKYEYSLIKSVLVTHGTKGMQVYPNPVKEYVTVEGLVGNEDIKVYDLAGKTLIKLVNGENNKMKIGLNELSKGSYLLHIKATDGTVLSQRFMKVE